MAPKTDKVLEKPKPFCLCSTFVCFLSKRNWHARSVLVVWVVSESGWLEETQPEEKSKKYLDHFVVQCIMQRQGLTPLPRQAQLLHRTVWPKTKTKLRGLSPHANYTDRAAAAGLFSRPGAATFFIQVAPQLTSRGWVDPKLCGICSLSIQGGGELVH